MKGGGAERKEEMHCTKGGFRSRCGRSHTPRAACRGPTEKRTWIETDTLMAVMYSSHMKRQVCFWGIPHGPAKRLRQMCRGPSM